MNRKKTKEEKDRELIEKIYKCLQDVEDKFISGNYQGDFKLQASKRILDVIEGKIIAITSKEVDILIEKHLSKYKVRPSMIIVPDYFYEENEKYLKINDYFIFGLKVVSSPAVKNSIKVY